MTLAAQIQLPEIVEDFTLLTPPEEPGDIRFWIVAGILALLAVLVPLYLALRPKRAETDDVTHVPPAPDPSIRARMRIASLREALPELSARDGAEETSGILRDYVFDRFQIRAPCQTTAEFLTVIRKQESFPRDHLGSTAGVLEASDFIKFAGGRLIAGSLESLVDAVEDLVTHTTPDPPPETGKTGEGA